MGINENLALSYRNGFIDCNLKSMERYNPKLLINDSKRDTKVLSTIQRELKNCNEFYFSVAFITESGIQSLLNALDEVASKGIRGKIVTSQYQNFTEPKALRRLLSYKNLSLRIVTQENFHAKGYIFRQEDSFSIIIGSSNLTQSALSFNKEWNLRLSSLEHGAVMQNIMKEFEYTFDNAEPVTENWIREYEKIYQGFRAAQRKSLHLADTQMALFQKISPNKMQIEALQQLEAIRKEGKAKALIISATGTGKTYLSAFDVAKRKPSRVLFVAHRENILKASLKSFKRVLGPSLDAGILSGGEKSFDCHYLFATIQTISQDHVLNKFKPDHFDYIVVDEVHRAGASSYQKLMNYFTPGFLLGMTATPERTDGIDIFQCFDYNIAYEIRLNRALEENMLVPFHYFGISDISVDGALLGNDVSFGQLVCDERVRQIIVASVHYGYHGNRLRGLIFCSRIDEAKILSERLNQRGFSTLALSGENSEEEREAAIRRLEQERETDKLDYILTVDIFNEGIDIPMVNQIIMLRPTESAIVFVQQLGRGLRKAEGKEYLTVIDFIGNYANNYLIPIALYGDRSYKKDALRKLVNGGSSMIAGCSTINFDAVSKEKIYAAIDAAKLTLLQDLRKDYLMMQYRLGRPPMMLDFFEQGGREPYTFISYSKSSYYSFVKTVDPKQHSDMKVEHQNLLAFYSKEILNVKRMDEICLLALLKAKKCISVAEFNFVMKQNTGYISDRQTVRSIIRNLNGVFLKNKDAQKYGIVPNISLLKMEGKEADDEVYLEMNADFWEEICSEPLSVYLDDMISYAFKRFVKEYKPDRFRKGFQLYEKYSRKDVCRILNWDKNEESTIYGYRIKHNTCPIFVTYEKSEKVEESQRYEDGFVNNACFSWMTRNQVKMESKEVVQIQNHAETGMRIALFIKKSDDEGTDFYYMGDVTPIDFTPTTICNGDGKELSLVNILFAMQDEVEDCMFSYFV